MIIKIGDGQAIIKDWVSMRLKHELQKMYWEKNEVGLAANEQVAKPTVIAGSVVLQAQDLAVKSLVEKLEIGGQIYTERDEILEKILDLPASDGEKIYQAVNQLLNDSGKAVPKV